MSPSVGYCILDDGTPQITRTDRREKEANTLGDCAIYSATTVGEFSRNLRRDVGPRLRRRPRRQGADHETMTTVGIAATAGCGGLKRWLGVDRTSTG